MTGNSAEATLWQTVLFQAVKDGLEAQRRADPPVELRVADTWIRRGGGDFRLICGLAGVEPEIVRDRYVAGQISLELLVMSETGNKRSLAKELNDSGKLGFERRSRNAAR